LKNGLAEAEGQPVIPASRADLSIDLSTEVPQHGTKAEASAKLEASRKRKDVAACPAIAMRRRIIPKLLDQLLRIAHVMFVSLHVDSAQIIPHIFSGPAPLESRLHVVEGYPS
jgi:hypothetical protein